MTADESRVPIYTPGREIRPIPALQAEPLERLLDHLRSGALTLLLHTGETVHPGWLTFERLENRLRSLPLNTSLAEVWPLLSDAWAISLSSPGEASDPNGGLYAQTLSRLLLEHLETEWRAEAGLPPVETPQISLPGVLPSTPGRTSNSGLFTLTPVARLSEISTLQDNIVELNALLEIIVNKQLHTQFQPIINLRDGHIFGYEALIRGPKGAPLRRAGSLFHAADKAQMVAWFDIACQEQCFLQAAQNGLKHHLFINMDAEGLAYMNFYDRSLAQRARDYGLTPASIVIEITERQTIDDVPELLRFVERLREEGFKIAIDDAGSGYNSLHTIAEMRPEFVKVDRALTRNLDVNGKRRALLAALVQFARQIGTSVLAEGSETREELATLIDLGVPYGQGYLMGRPADEFRGLPRQTREFIQERAQMRARLAVGRVVTVGELARRGLAMTPETPLEEAARKFVRDESLTSVVVMEDNFARGLLMRDQLGAALEMVKAAEAGALLPNETVAQWMHTDILSAPEDAPVTEIAQQMTARADIRFDADVVVVNSDGRYVGIVPARTLMSAATSVQENRLRYADPLTGLPGLVPLEQALRERLAASEPVAVLRADLDLIEPFNRRYGAERGDAIIQALARLLQETSAAHGRANDFLAHLGGDDFLLVTAASAAPGICRALMEGFEKIMPQFYTPEQMRLGYMQVEERSGAQRAPLASLTVVGVTNRKRTLTHYGQVADELQRLLRQVKPLAGNRYAIDFVPKAA